MRTGTPSLDSILGVAQISSSLSMCRRHGATPGDVPPRWVAVGCPGPHPGTPVPRRRGQPVPSSVGIPGGRQPPWSGVCLPPSFPLFELVSGFWRLFSVSYQILPAAPLACDVLFSYCSAGSRRRLPLLRPGISRCLSLSAASLWLIISSQKEVIALRLSSLASSALIKADGDRSGPIVAVKPRALYLKGFTHFNCGMCGVKARAAVVACSRFFGSYSL